LNRMAPSQLTTQRQNMLFTATPSFSFWILMREHNLRWWDGLTDRQSVRDRGYQILRRAVIKTSISRSAPSGVLSSIYLRVPVVICLCPRNEATDNNVCRRHCEWRMFCVGKRQTDNTWPGRGCLFIYRRWLLLTGVVEREQIPS